MTEFTDRRVLREINELPVSSGRLVHLGDISEHRFRAKHLPNFCYTPGNVMGEYTVDLKGTASSFTQQIHMCSKLRIDDKNKQMSQALGPVVPDPLIFFFLGELKPEFFYEISQFVNIDN